MHSSRGNAQKLQFCLHHVISVHKMLFTHVYGVPVVSDSEVPVDAVLVNVGDDGHVGHAIVGTAAWND